MRGVSQISPPIRIVLVATIGLIAAWMLFLRPSADVETTKPPAAPGVTGLSNAVDKAKDAAAAQEARDGKVQGATGEESGKSAGAEKSEAAQATAQKALATGRVLALAPLADDDVEGLPKGIQAALDRRDVFAIGVFNTRNKAWAPMAADDRRVRRALRDANRYGGRVTVHVGHAARPHEASPRSSGTSTSRRARRWWSSTATARRPCSRATSTASRSTRRSPTPAATPSRSASRTRTSTSSTTPAATTSSGSTASSTRSRRAPASSPRSAGSAASSATYQHRFAALKAPARYKGLQSQLMGVMRSDRRTVAAISGAVKRNDYRRALNIINGVDLAAAVALDKRFDSTGVTGCVSNRRS